MKNATTHSRLFAKYAICCFALFAPLLAVGQEVNQEGLAKLEQLDARLTGKMADTTRLRLLREAADLATQTDRSLLGKYLDPLLPLAEKTGDFESVGFYHSKLATLDYFNGNLEAAIGKYQTASTFYDKAGTGNMAIQMRTRAGLMDCLQGRYAEAEKIYRTEMGLATKGRYDDALAFLFNQMGTLYHYQNGVDSAIFYYEKSEKVYAALKDTLGMLRPMSNHAVLEFNSGDMQKAVEIHLHIAAIREKKGATHDLLTTYNTLATYYEGMGQYFEAMEYAQKSIAITDKLGDVAAKVDAIQSLARISKKTNDYEKVFRLLNEGRALAENAKNMPAIISSNIEFAAAKLDHKDYREAADIFEKTLAKMKEEGNDSRHRPLVTGYLGEAYLYLGEYDKSQRLLEEAMELFQQAGDEGLFLEFHYSLGLLYLKKGMPQKAVELGEKSYAHLLSSNRAENRMHNAEMLAKAYKQLGNYPKALSYYETFMALSDSLINIENVRVLTAKEKDFEFQMEKNEMAIQQAQQEALLRAETKQARTAAVAVAIIGLLGFGFFWNARRKNRIITAQNEQLAHLNDTKDRLFSIIGHDLRKPAIAFRGIAQKVNYLLKKQDYPTLQQLGEEIEQDALALNKLTDNLLNWALTQKNVMPYNPQAVQMAEVAEETVAIFQKTAADKGVALTTDIPEGLRVYADINALRTILRNLVDNAIKFTPAGGQVSISAAPGPDGIRLTVNDTGLGMTEEKARDLLLLQSRKSEAGTDGEKGTGLGLHLVQELAKLNKGAVEVASKLGKGTSIVVLLPTVAG